MDTPKIAPVALTECPSCGSDNLQEYGYCWSWQNVNDLRADGSADDYGDGDYGDVDIVGWGCGDCDWSLCGDHDKLHAVLYQLYEDALGRLEALIAAKAAGVQVAA